MLNFYYSASGWNVIAVMMADFWNFWFFAEFLVFHQTFGFPRNFWDFTEFFVFRGTFGFSRNFSSPKFLLLSRLETSEKRSILWADFFFVKFLSRTSPKYLEKKDTKSKTLTAKMFRLEVEWSIYTNISDRVSHIHPCTDKHTQISSRVIFLFSFNFLSYLSLEFPQSTFLFSIYYSIIV